jgi:tRNA threonylcarbamoyladenosine biosynthesis protein TsaB
MSDGPQQSAMVLSIDTCGTSGTVALARWTGHSVHVLDQKSIPGKTYSAQVIPEIRDLLAAHKTFVSDIAAIVVTSGPGSFTGIRIGLATAKGLAELHATPIVAVSRLAVLAHKAHTSAAALDASRHEFYFGRYTADPAEQLLARDHFLQLSTTLAHDLGVCELSVHDLVPAATLVDPPTAADAIDLALPRLRARDYDDPLTLDGNYLRRSDAEIFAKSPRPGSRQLDSPRP